MYISMSNLTQLNMFASSPDLSLQRFLHVSVFVISTVRPWGPPQTNKHSEAPRAPLRARLCGALRSDSAEHADWANANTGLKLNLRNKSTNANINNNEIITILLIIRMQTTSILILQKQIPMLIRVLILILRSTS